jgi:hypothetical protein
MLLISKEAREPKGQISKALVKKKKKSTTNPKT